MSTVFRSFSCGIQEKVVHDCTVVPFLLKILISGLIIAAASELAKRSSLAAAVLVSLPMISILAMVWLWHDTHDADKIVAFSYGIFWMVIPSLFFFLVLPFLLKRQIPFVWAMPLSCLAMAGAYGGYLWLLKRIGVNI